MMEMGLNEMNLNEVGLNDANLNQADFNQTKHEAGALCTPPPPPQLARVLPTHLADALRKAAQTPVPAHDPLARLKAIEKASERIRFNHPQYFVQEQ